MERQETFIFRIKWRDAIAALPDGARLEIYEGILDYVSGFEPTLSPLAQGAFLVIKIEIDKQIENYQEMLANKSRAGKIGGGNPNFKKGQPNPYYHKQDKQTLTDINKDKQVIMSDYEKINRDKQTLTDINEINTNNNINNNSNSNIDINNNKISINTAEKEKKEEYKEEKKESADFIHFKNWLQENTPSILRMREPFNEKEFDKIRVYPPELVKRVLLAMHNWNDLVKKNRSAYMTFLNWMKREPFRDSKVQDERSNIERMSDIVANSNAALAGRQQGQRLITDDGTEVISMYDDYENQQN